MAVIGPCKYQDGRLIEPTKHQIRRARFSAAEQLGGGGRLTLEPGNLHVHAVTGAGVTADAAKKRAKEKLQKVFDIVEWTSGYRKIGVERSQGMTPCNGEYAVSYQLVYAIEDQRKAARSKTVADPSNRTRVPEWDDSYEAGARVP